MSAIRLKVKKARGKYDKGCSKFFGSPTLPEGLENELDNDTIFLLQIRLSDIKDLDEDNILPHEGYLYFFIDTAGGDYDLKPIVKYYKGEPTTLIDEFNAIVDGYEHLTKEYLVEFERCADDETGNKLLGVPSDWNYMEEPRRMLFQYDPLDVDMGFLTSLDGLLYFFFDGKNDDFDNISLMEEYSQEKKRI